ncbi:uncharacterized protein [Embiotoca jacksoni]|uniref:uncharacterized protein isoform X1 n=1 Tax=Embiotoca jacksoni TaxID=100190 RepID=UPI003703B7EE
MKSLFLLIVTLIAGCEVRLVEKHSKGWVSFMCSAPKTSGKYQMTAGDSHKQISTRLLNVTIEQQEPEDLKNQKRVKDFIPPCDKPSETSPGSVELHFEVAEKDRNEMFIQTYKSAKTTIRCDDYKDKNKSDVKFFCKDKTSTCKNETHWTFLTDASGGFNVSITNVSLKDEGVYWCGIKFNNEAALKRIKLVVHDIRIFNKSYTAGDDVSYFCIYKDLKATKFICKGEDKSVCQTLVNSKQPDSNKRFLMNNNKPKKNISVTVKGVTTADGGTYWCGEESDTGRLFLHKFFLSVEPPPSAAPPLGRRPDGWTVRIAAIASGIVLLLLFGILFIFIYKRFLHSKQTENGAAVQDREDSVYDQIQERSQRSTDPSAMHYATISFQGRDGQMVNDSSSTCQYSAVKYSQNSTYSTVNHGRSARRENI